MKTPLGTHLEIYWLGDAQIAHVAIEAKTSVGEGDVLHEDLEEYFEAYLVSRGFIVTKSEKRVIADRRAANDAVPQPERLDAGSLDVDFREFEIGKV